MLKRFLLYVLLLAACLLGGCTSCARKTTGMETETKKNLNNVIETDGQKQVTQAPSNDAKTVTKTKGFSDITVFETIGKVNVIRDEKTLTAAKDMKLRFADQVDVLAEGFVRICLDDDIFAHMESKTKASIVEKANQHIAIEMTEGELVLEVQRKLSDDEKLEIITPNTNMGIRGTVVAVKCIPYKEGIVKTYCYVLEGSAVVTLPDDTMIELQAGSGWVVTTDDSGSIIESKEADATLFEFKDIELEDLKGAESADLVLNRDGGIFDDQGNKLLEWGELPIQCSSDGRIYSEYYNINEAGYKVSKLGSQLQSLGMTGLTLVIPEGITEIGNGIFCGVNQIKNVELPDSVTVIGEGAFKNQDVEFIRMNYAGVNQKPERCKYKLYTIDEAGFNSGIETINIPNGVTSIERSAFQGCISLRTIDIPESVKKIGQAAFLGCRSLEKVAIPEGVEYIEGSTFYLCDNLKEVQLPETVYKIGSFAFGSCTKLEEININHPVVFWEDSGSEVSAEIMNVQYGAFSETDSLNADIKAHINGDRNDRMNLNYLIFSNGDAG